MITRRRFAALGVALACGSCGVAAPRRFGWEDRLRGDAIVLLGEVHDNPQVHRLRLGVLRRALEAGWRPAVAMEQFDTGRQDDIERARHEHALDAQHLIDAAAPPATRSGGGWDWDFYRPVVELVLKHDLPLLAANLSSTDTTRIVREGYAAVFDETDRRSLGLDRPIDAQWAAAQEEEIDAGHCHMLPRNVWPRMARAQFARDAVMAATLRRHADRGVVLLAGNGHVRRDIGVPRWLDEGDLKRCFAVGFLEEDSDAPPPTAFDAVVRAAPHPREDPCEAFKARRPIV